MTFINIKNCPVCEKENSTVILLGKDYSTSKEEFPISKCNNCGFVFTQNIPDEESIGKYYNNANYVSHSNTKKGLFFKVYHLVRSFMLKQKCKLVIKETKKTKGKILDVGSATGYFLNEMKLNGWEIEGIEQDENAIALGKEKFNIDANPPSHINSFENNSFDCITLWHVLEHVHQLSATVSNLNKLLKPEGVLIIAVPNHESYDANYYERYWAGWDIPIHLWHFSTKSMQDLMIKHNFEVVKKKTMPFDPFYVSLLSEKYKKGSGLIGLFIGLCSMVLGYFNINKSSSIIYVIKKKI